MKLQSLLLLLAGDRFVVTRRLGLEDYRLVVLQIFLKLCVLAYIVLWQLCTMHQYAKFEPVSGYANLWDAELANISISRGYCSNPKYDWGADFTDEEASLAGRAEAINIECTPFDRSRHILIDSNSFVAVTSEAYTYHNGTTKYFFTESPERAAMNAIHGFTASFLENGVINPPATLSRKSGEVFRSFDSQKIFGPLSMADVLLLSGVSLDARNKQPWFRGGNLSQSPFYRLSGVVIIMRIAYSNFRDYEFAGSPRSGAPLAQVTVESLPNAWGFLGRAQALDPATLLPVSVRRTGIKVQLILSGQAGRFDLMELVRRILEGVVLFGVAAYGTELAARWLLYRESYDRLTSDHIAWEQLAVLRAGAAAAAAPTADVEGRPGPAATATAGGKAAAAASAAS